MNLPQAIERVEKWVPSASKQIPLMDLRALIEAARKWEQVKALTVSTFPETELERDRYRQALEKIESRSENDPLFINAVKQFAREALETDDAK